METHCGTCKLRHREGNVTVCDVWGFTMSMDTITGDWFKCGNCEDDNKNKEKYGYNEGGI